MKFGKFIRTELKNSSSLHLISFKQLKRLIKQCLVSAEERNWLQFKNVDEKFVNTLYNDMKEIENSFLFKFQLILNLHESLKESVKKVQIQPVPASYQHLSFEALLTHLQSEEHLVEELNLCSSTQINTSKNLSLYEICIKLNTISIQCKDLRRCVLWNSVGIVKILKKRRKYLSKYLRNLIELSVPDVLSKQNWYNSRALSQLVSSVETAIDELMQRLTQQPVNREHYQCPICLDIIIDPVCLRACGHRFCLACLCMTYCEKPEGGLERCPCCRTVFPLSPGSFRIDGILSRFLRTFFPEAQYIGAKEHETQLRLKLSKLRFQRESEINQTARCCQNVKSNGKAGNLSNNSEHFLAETQVRQNNDNFNLTKIIDEKRETPNESTVSQTAFDTAPQNCSIINKDEFLISCEENNCLKLFLEKKNTTNNTKDFQKSLLTSRTTDFHDMNEVSFKISSIFFSKDEQDWINSNEEEFQRNTFLPEIIPDAFGFDLSEKKNFFNNNQKIFSYEAVDDDDDEIEALYLQHIH